jgi:hypothetical protein
LKVPIFDPERIFVKIECAEKNRKNRTGLRFRLIVLAKNLIGFGNLELAKI